MAIAQSKRRIVVSFLAAAALCAVLSSLVQTQFNLLALQAIGVNASHTDRLETFLHDLGHFAPLYLVIFSVGFAVSQWLAAQLAKRTGLPTVWSVLGAILGLLLTFKVIDMIAPMPTLIAATRTGSGQVALLAVAAFAGLLFSKWSRFKPLAALAFIAFLGVPAGEALAQQGTYKVRALVEGLEYPWAVAFLPDGRALITERPGRLRVVNAQGVLNPQPLQGVPAVFAAGQAGLFDVLLAPDFAQSKLVYLSYACGSRQSNSTCVSRGRLGDQGLEQTQEIFNAQLNKAGGAHFGGRMAWLADGTLILTLGDGFNYREKAQTLDNNFGKIVRLNPDGSIPADNPFVNKPGAKPEIFSFGHRNVQGLAFDRKNKRLIAHEHGPRGGDEINVIEVGKNHGWPIATYGIDYTGARISPFTEYEGTQQPALHWTPSIAPSGMIVYDGELFPQWKGHLFVGALAARDVRRVVLNGNKATDTEVLFKELGERIRDVRTGPDGAIYLLTDSPSGKLLRVTPQ